MSQAPARLLYIDDDPGLRRLIERTLPRHGFVVQTAEDGIIGADLAALGGFDVIAIDHFMPVQDGLTTLAAILLQPAPPPVVYVTAADESRIAVAALKAGAADYVVKTASSDFADLLASALRGAVSQRRLREERDAAATALVEANARLEAVVERQTTLLAEMNHRVANSLQLVSTLVHMQATQVEDQAARAALRDTQARIAAIMQIHRRLYTSDDVHSVDATEYLRGLLKELELSLSIDGARRPILFDAGELQLDTDRAVSLGVVVTELVTNAHKYAYAPDQPGEIRVSMHPDDAHAVRLVVEDDGAGFSAGQAPKGTGLGRRVISAMARSLNADLTYDAAHQGARAVLRFPVTAA
ncbi:acid-responsive two-component system sensor/response regulator FsrR [soil metagenome]